MVAWWLELRTSRLEPPRLHPTRAPYEVINKIKIKIKRSTIRFKKVGRKIQRLNPHKAKSYNVVSLFTDGNKEKRAHKHECRDLIDWEDEFRGIFPGVVVSCFLVDHKHHDALSFFVPCFSYHFVLPFIYLIFYNQSRGQKPLLILKK
jgi:hypothetical protein